MLAELAIRDIVLIDRLELAFGPGMSVLTGETGAGKSILLDAVALALGGRGDGGLVREGAAQGQVTAVFDLRSDHPARAVLAAQELPDDGALVLRRVQMPDGRSRAYVNDQPVGVQILRAIGATLVEIHGQHADRALVDPNAHRALVDAFGGLAREVEAVGALWKTVRRAREELEAHRQRVATAAREGDFLRHASAELQKLAPKPGEEEELATRRQGMMQAEKIAADLADAADALGGSAAPGPTLVAQLRKLERRTAQAPALVAPIVEGLSRALDALEDARAAVEAAQRAADHDPRELERIEERLFALRAAARKYAVPVDGLAALAERFAGDLAALDAGEERLVVLERAVGEAETRYRAAAEALSAQRRAAAAELDAAVEAELPPLKLERARFTTQVAPGGEGAEGLDAVEFWVRTNPGTRPGPMVKVASGGELARFMLALKVVLADRGSAPTLVFDEIDTGVGGAVADAIGQRLARLADRVQVMCVTHAPQVAARADRHFRIAKEPVSPADERVATRVEVLAPDHRREEIARMLAGAVITDEARAAAARLLAAAG